MSPARKTAAVVTLAGVVAIGAFLLHRGHTAASAAEPSAGVASGGGVTMRAMLQSGMVLRGTHDTYLALTLYAPGEAGSSRPPLDLAIVIDRSGSMSGEKLAQAKQAAYQLLAELDARDHVAIVAYGSDVDTVFASQLATDEAKRAAQAAVARIYDDGGTNLSGGLVAGASEIFRARNPEAVGRIVLISDGIANEGLFASGDLQKLSADTASRGVSITTVGVGLDFDERTMTSIANSGRGNYYFVESAAALPQMFETEMARLGATVATDVSVTFATTPGVQVLEALGYPMYQHDGVYQVPVADLYAGEHRKLVLRLRVSAEQAGTMPLGTFDARFRPVGADDATRTSVTVSARVTDSRDEWQAHIDRDAARHIERALTAKAIDEATALYEKGHAAEATKTLRDRAADAAQMAQSIGYDGLEAEIQAATDKADNNFKAAPQPASTGGKRGRKANISQARDLFKE